jgi:hypothetical protein
MADIRQLILETAQDLGVSPVDLATVMSYETGGTMNPMQVGSIRTRFGTHRGFIQFGEPQAQQYGVDFSSPEAAVHSQLGRGKAVSRYLKNAGVRPGTNLLGLEAAINGGNVGATNAVDNGTTVIQKVSSQMGSHQRKAQALMSGAMNFQPATTGGSGMLPPGYGDKGTNLATIDYGDPTSYLPEERDKSPYEDLASTFADAVGISGNKGLLGEQALAPDQGETKPPPFEYGSAIPSVPPPADAPPPGSLAADASSGTGGLADIFKIGDFGQAGAAIDPMTGLPASRVLRTRRNYG